MESWAFATSKDGLGLTTEQNWDLTPREFQALVAVHERALYRWAVQQSMFANAHFRGKDDEAFVAEQFMGKPKPKEKPMHPAFQKALIDQAMNVLPPWFDQLKNARKQ